MTNCPWKGRGQGQGIANQRLMNKFCYNLLKINILQRYYRQVTCVWKRKTVDGVIAKFTTESASDRVLTRGQSNLTKSRIVAVRTNCKWFDKTGSSFLKIVLVAVTHRKRFASFYDQPLRRYITSGNGRPPSWLVVEGHGSFPVSYSIESYFKKTTSCFVKSFTVFTVSGSTGPMCVNIPHRSSHYESKYRDYRFLQNGGRPPP